MLISTLSYYTTELYKEFAAYTTEKLHELGLNFGQMYFIIMWANILSVPHQN